MLMARRRVCEPINIFTAKVLIVGSFGAPRLIMIHYGHYAGDGKREKARTRILPPSAVIRHYGCIIREGERTAGSVRGSLTLVTDVGNKMESINVSGREERFSLGLDGKVAVPRFTRSRSIGLL